MIISHTHEFIFLKTRKTASTSVEMSLSRYCGPMDVITQISPDDEAWRIKHLNTRAQNCILTRPKIRGDIHQSEAGLAQRIAENVYGQGNSVVHAKTHEMYNHMPAKDVRALVGERIWRRYLKFCVERDPEEFYLSLYDYHRYPCTIDEFVDSPAAEGNDRIYCIDGEVGVDHVLPYTRLSAALYSVCVGSLQMPWDGWLPQAKAGHRLPGTPDERLKPETREKIRRRYAKSYEVLYGAREAP
jgi:hypothetical protein